MSAENNRKKDRKNISAGASALISVLAVPVTLLASLLIFSRHKV